MAKRTTATILDELFDVFVETLKDRLTNEPTAADLNVVRTFLKDNGIEFIGESNTDEERRQLADLLPFKADEAYEA